MAPDRTMTALEMAKTLNEWMRRFIEEPEKFKREFETVQSFLKDEADGREPSYGEICSSYQFKLLDEMATQ